MNRFSQKDAYRGITASTISLNRYAYCYNDPVNYKDPSGKLGLLAGAAIVGGIVGGVVGAVKSIATQKASGGTVSVKTVIKSAAVGVVAGAVGAVVATAATVALATTFGAATITGAASLTMAQSIGVGSISAVLGGVASRYSGAVTSNAINAGAYVDPVSSAFNSSAMLTDLVFGGFAGAATGYATDGIYQTYESLRYEQNIKYTSSRTADSPETETPKSLGIRSCNGKDLAKNVDELDDAITSTRSASVSESIADSGREAFELSNPSSSILRKNMIESGVEPPKYSNAAHHIVAGNSKNAAEARAILQKYEIDINDASNGVFLPTVKDVTESTYHPSLHTNSYYEKVTDMLRTATSREDAIEILQDIGEQLSLGIF